MRSRSRGQPSEAWLHRHPYELEASRPATVKAEDIEKLEYEDEEGWAGQQQEVDYSAKLRFEDSDESDDDNGSDDDDDDNVATEKRAQSREEAKETTQRKSAQDEIRRQARFIG